MSSFLKRMRPVVVAVARADQHGLTCRQLAVMVELWAWSKKVPPSTRNISELLNLDKPVISRACTKLEELGFISSAVDPNDRRLRQLAITSKGIGYINTLDGIAGETPRAEPAKTAEPAKAPKAATKAKAKKGEERAAA